MPRNSSKRWTPEEDDLLRTLIETGTSALLIAAKLKRGVHATKARAYAIGISFRRVKAGLKAKGK